MTKPPRLLIVDDEPGIARVIERLAAKVGFAVETCLKGTEAMGCLLRRPADLAMVDLRMPDLNGMELLRKIRASHPGCEVILMTGFGAVDSAVEAIKLGAREYLTKPFDLERLRKVLADTRDEIERRAQIASLEGEMAKKLQFCGMLGRSPAMQEVFSLIQRLAPHAKVVFITGETGTGKELAARAFHQSGPRKAWPFVTVNCSGVVEPLFEAELFGYVRGAFPGANDSRGGLFETAQGGTIFFDEVAELPAGAQARLLRTIENGEMQRIGSLQARRLDVLVIAATNRDLQSEVAAGRFRGDLFYRLNVVGVTLPPLRQRREDIPYLTSAFMRETAMRLRKPLSGFTPGAERLLLSSRWPGNVRELRNAIERACMLAQTSVISERELQPALASESLEAVRARLLKERGNAPPEDDSALATFERGQIVEVLRQMRGNRMAAAKVLGISRRALYRRLHRYQIGADAPPRRAYLPRPTR